MTGSGASPLDGAPIGTVVVRDGLITYANEAILALVALPRDRLVGHPFLEFIAAEDAPRVAARHARRQRGEAAPEVYETTLAVGARRWTVQVHVASRGAEAIAQLIDITLEAARRDRLGALARIGAAVQRLRRDGDVHRAVGEALSALEVETLLLRAEGRALRVERADFCGPSRAHVDAVLGDSLVGLAVAWSDFTRDAWSGGAAFTHDWIAEGRHLLGDRLPPPASSCRTPAASAVRVDVHGEPAALLVVVGDWLRPEDLPAFQLFGAQVSAALDAAHSIAELSARNAELDALNRIAGGAATASDLASFLEGGAADAAAAVGAATAVVFLVDREHREARLLHAHGHRDDARRELEHLPLDGTPSGEVAVDGIARVCHAEDVPEPDRGTLVRSGLATVAGVPLRYRSSVLGVLSVGFRERRDEAACGLDLLQAMAAHFAAAIETHRLLGDLRGRVAELTLLNDIAVASATLDPVLLVENALRRVTSTFGADAACAYLASGGDLQQVAALGLSAEDAACMKRVAPGIGPAGAAFEHRKALQLSGAGVGHDAGVLAPQPGGIRCVVAVPLLAKERALGALVLGRRREEPFSDAELSLLSAVGVQLGVAVENARLFADTRRRVEDLEAVNSLALSVFGSAPGDAAALLAATCKEIARALSARSAVVLQLDASGESLRGVAGFGAPLRAEELAVPLARSELAARALRTQEPAWGLHLFEDAPTAPPPLSLLLVPLTARGATRGLVAVADAPQRRFSDAEVALAYALASEAAIGLENAELYAEARRRAEELSMLLEGGRALVATLDLDEVLDAGVRNLARIVDAPIAALCLADGGPGTLVIRAQAGPHPEIVGTVQRGPSLARLAYARREPVAVEDARSDPRADARLTEVTGAGGVLALPLVVHDRAIGAVVIVESRGPRRFTPSEVERATAIANQLAVAVEHARLYEDLRRSYAELARAQDQLVHQERLAALGELAAIVAHEVRNPLGVIFNSLGSLRRMLQPTGAAKMLLGMVGEEAERLNRIVGDLLDFARPSPPALRPEPLDRVIEDALSGALAGGAARVAVTRDVPPDLPSVPMDARLVRQALLNLTLNAVQAMPGGGTLSVRARVDGAAARIEIADTGPGIADEVRHRIFEPFFTTKATGSGLGLAVVKRIVDDHRGALEVRSSPGEGTTFIVRLPLEAPVAVEKQDRPE